MPNILDSIHAVLFDIGSTLVMGPSVSPNKEVIRRFALTADTAAKVGRLIMCTDFQGPADVCAAISGCGIPITKDDCDFVSRLWSDQETAPVPIAGGLEAVQFFKNAGKKIGLLSDIWAPYYRGFARVCPQISDVAEVKHLSFRVGVKKPEAAFFESAIQAMQAAPERILMVGDTYSNDIAPGIQQGMKTAWVLSRAEREVSELIGVIEGRLSRPDVTVASILELQSAVTKELSGVHQDHQC